MLLRLLRRPVAISDLGKIGLLLVFLIAFLIAAFLNECERAVFHKADG